MIIKTVLQANTCLRDVYVHANLFSSSSSSEIHVKLVYLIKFHPSDVHVKFDRISVVFSELRRTLFKFGPILRFNYVRTLLKAWYCIKVWNSHRYEIFDLRNLAPIAIIIQLSPSGLPTFSIWWGVSRFDVFPPDFYQILLVYCRNLKARFKKIA